MRRPYLYHYLENANLFVGTVSDIELSDGLAQGYALFCRMGGFHLGNHQLLVYSPATAP